MFFGKFPNHQYYVHTTAHSADSDLSYDSFSVLRQDSKRVEYGCHGCLVENQNQIFSISICLSKNQAAWILLASRLEIVMAPMFRKEFIHYTSNYCHANLRLFSIKTSSFGWQPYNHEIQRKKRHLYSLIKF